jgi:hypothetical protein
MLKNGNETGTDCGGVTTCARCPAGQGCGMGSDCVSLVCTGNACVAATCGDNVKNQNETDTDCGGTCAPTKKCAVGKGCMASGDCASGVCTGGVCQTPTCSDTVKNGGETDTDCGGNMCSGCGTGKGCLAGTDCTSKVCTTNICQAATCSDNAKNQNETDVDCGGICAPTKKCAVGKGCMVAGDCQSATCTTNVCQPSTASGLKVLYTCLDSTQPTDRFIQYAFELQNTSPAPVPLSELKVRYWFTLEAGDAPVFHCSGALCTFVTAAFVTVSPARPNADRYLEISFTGSTTLAAGEISSFLQITVDRVSVFNENNDYSHDASKVWPTFSEWTHVTMYRLGAPVWGTEP